MINPKFLVPEVPIDVALTPRDDLVAHWLIGICSVGIAAGIVYAIREWKRSGSPSPLLLIVGVAVAGLFLVSSMGKK